MEKTIFVVDDSDTCLATAKDALKEHYRVMTLPSPAKLFKFLERLMPDLILLDIEMPDRNGFDVLQQLKNTPEYAGIPVIFLTSISDAAVEERGFQLGAVDFISKPFSAAVLQNRVKAHLEIDALVQERANTARPHNSPL